MNEKTESVLGRARLRFCVIADHTPEQITVALDALKEAAEELHITLPAPNKE